MCLKCDDPYQRSFICINSHEAISLARVFHPCRYRRSINEKSGHATSTTKANTSLGAHWKTLWSNIHVFLLLL